MGPKNCKFLRVPKVLASAEPQGVVGGCKNLNKRMAMQSSCNGLLTKSKSQKNNESRRGNSKKNSNSHFFSRQENMVEPQRVVSSRLITLLRNTKNFSYGQYSIIFGPDLLTIWSPPHCLTQPKVGKQSAFPSLTTALFAATGDFPSVDGKTHCALNHGTY